MLKTEQRMKWCGEGETEPMENVCWPLWKNGKNDCFLQKLIVQQNFQLSTSQSLGLHFSLCQWKQKMGIGHYEKNGCHFVKTHHTGKFPITNLPQGLGLYFPLWWWKQKTGISHHGKKWKNGCHFTKTCHTAKFPITNPLKAWVSVSFQFTPRVTYV